jgi:putative acetyltransferase
MIRKHTTADLDQILDIWYQSSTIAHAFLNDDFVDKVKVDMRNIYIPGSDSWVYEKDGEIIGFISMIGNEIAGLFVLPHRQSIGIGTLLVDYVRKTHSELEVEVFEKNEIGRAFYKKYGFKMVKQFFHEESNQELLRLKLKD